MLVFLGGFLISTKESASLNHGPSCISHYPRFVIVEWGLGYPSPPSLMTKPGSRPFLSRVRVTHHASYLAHSELALISSLDPICGDSTRA